MFRQILLCTDGSGHAVRAAEAAAELAGRLGASILVLYVHSLPTITSGGSGASSIDYDPQLFEELERKTRDQVKHRTCGILDHAGIAYEFLAVSGSPVETILEVAQSRGADLIVLGSRGLGGFRAFLLGSVSDSIAHASVCPVLIVK